MSRPTILMVEIKKLERSGGADIAVVHFVGGSFRIPVDMLLDKGIQVGMQLELCALEELRIEAGRALAVIKAARLASARPISKKELQEKLVRKGDSREDAKAAAERMEELGAVNEREYARNVVRTYSSKGYGRGRILHELRRRGVPRELWEEVLTLMPEPREAIDRYLQRHLRDPSDAKELKRASDALYRRGFDWDDIRAQIHRVTGGIPEEE